MTITETQLKEWLEHPVTKTLKTALLDKTEYYTTFLSQGIGPDHPFGIEGSYYYMRGVLDCLADRSVMEENILLAYIEEENANENTH